MKLVRVILALVALAFLLLTVRGWWTEYESASQGTGSTAVPAETSATPEPTPVTPAPEVTLPQEPVEDVQVLVVLTDGLNFREGPDNDSIAIRGLDKGEKVTVVKKDDGWYQVTTDQGETGWITDNPSYTRTEKP